MLLSYMQTQRFRPGEQVLRSGQIDRAFYLLTDGRLQREPAEGAPAQVIEPPATVGVAAFLDGLPRAVTLLAIDHGELLRLGFEAWEALCAREPALGRAVLLDLARGLAAGTRASGHTLPGWSG